MIPQVTATMLVLTGIFKADADSFALVVVAATIAGCDIYNSVKNDTLIHDAQIIHLGASAYLLWDYIHTQSASSLIVAVFLILIVAVVLSCNQVDRLGWRR